MKPMPSCAPLTIALALMVAAGSALAGGDGYSSLPSAKHLANPWAHYIQIEHKGGDEQSTSNLCVSGQDLLHSFPPKDGSGLYWDYVARFQKDRLATQFDLGSIDGTRITEILIRFEEPVDYIKILAFTPANTDLLCPFVTIADMDSVLEYSRSELVEVNGVRMVQTSMLDHIAFKAPRSISIHFVLKNDRPQWVELPDAPH